MRIVTTVLSACLTLGAVAGPACAQDRPPLLTLFAEEAPRFSAAMPVVPNFPSARSRQSMRLRLGEQFAGRTVDVAIQFEQPQAAPVTVFSAGAVPVRPGGVVFFAPASAGGWRPGTYVVVVRDGGREVARLTYRVVR